MWGSSTTKSVAPWCAAILLVFSLGAPGIVLAAEEDGVELGEMSDFSRSMAAQSASVTTPSSLRGVRRRSFPEQDPHICLAFLSCCDRTDLLNHTISAAIRHMEEDEPDNLRYEIAWVDNGSGSELTQDILDSYQIEHALPMEENLGLAYGMNLLIKNLCTAPYILLLEEDWLYLDELVTDQTERRKSAIATAIAFSETNQIAYDGREVMGVFLRPETYGTFLKFPWTDVWQDVTVDLSNLPSSDNDTSDTDDCNAEPRLEEINFQVICSDTSTTGKYIWGSYTNGAGLYKRSSLMNVGRMYGEPGDAFHDRYVESNFAYRTGLKYCHAAIQLGDCRDLSSHHCAAAFHHIGGGRGTRPMRATNTNCATQLWNFVGTPIFQRYMRLMGDQTEMCSREEIQELKNLKEKERDAADYVKEVKEISEVQFEKERADRDKLIQQARDIRQADKNQIRQHVQWMAHFTDEEIMAQADKMDRRANSPHPIGGHYDSHGRPLEKKA